MLNNNSCGFIGSTHSSKYITSNDLINTSNNLINNIIYNSNIIENDIIITSNKLISYTNNTSNKIINKLWEVNPDNNLCLIKTIGESNVYISNLKFEGEIRFKVVDNINNVLYSQDHLVRINKYGKLELYHIFDPFLPTYASGWYEISRTLIGALFNIDTLNLGVEGIGITIGLIEGQIGDIYELIAILQAQLGNTNNGLEFTQDLLYDKNVLNTNHADLMKYRDNYTNLAQDFAQITDRTRTTTQTIVNTTSTVVGQYGLALQAGGIAVGIIGAIYGLFESKKNYNYASNLSNVNFEITSNQRKSLLESNLINSLSIANDLSVSMSNAQIIQGFINSNIQTAQYISSIKCNNLDLNTGNISGINYVNVNNIVADGKIKENNKFLDATYLTSNHLYNLAYGYSSEREYPPKTFTTATPETTTTFLNKLVYKQTLFLDTNFITHGNGYYEIYSSSTYDIDTPKSLLFNHNTSDIKNARWFINLYNFGTGLYLGDNSIDGSYYGDWVIIKLPQPIVLTKFRFYTGGAVNSSPGTWKCYGSTDGLIFTEITEGSQTTSITTANYSSGFYEKSLNPSFTTLYQYFGFVVNKLVSINSFRELRFGELRLYGKEVISNSITSSIYTTSNVCKNLILYDTPQVNKKNAFYCQTNTTIYPNAGSTPFYAYHIDLRNYTKTGIMQLGQTSGEPYRVFKIRCFFGASYFQKLTNGIPDICDYTIHMSNKTAAGGDGSIAGINIMAIGTPQNYFLNNIMQNNLFILRNANNNFDYLTVVSTSAADVRVFIEDLLN